MWQRIGFIHIGYYDLPKKPDKTSLNTCTCQKKKGFNAIQFTFRKKLRIKH